MTRLRKILFRLTGWPGMLCPFCLGKATTNYMRYGRDGWVAAPMECSRCHGKGRVVRP